LFEPKNQPKTNLIPKKAGRPKVSRVKCFERTKLIIDTESAKLGLSELHFVEKILSFYIDGLCFVPPAEQEQKIPKLKLLEPTKKLKKLDENLYEKNGYACPKCSNELYDTSDLIINSQKQIHCECGYVGHRKV
jgi:DNA-directed RNA polymerase subunit RPC12/RpoP